MEQMKEKMLPEILDIQNQEETFSPEAELIYILRGEMSIEIYEKPFTLKNEDVIVVNANERYRFRASEDVLFARFRIPGIEAVSGVNEVYHRFLCNSAMNDMKNYDELRRVLKKLLISDLNVREHSNRVSYAYMSCFYELMHLLTVHFMTGIPENALSKREKNEQRLYKITRYIEKNYNQDISFESLAQYMYLSEGYLSRYFKENFHMRFSDYVRKVRLEHAMEALLYTGRPVTKIAYDVGFSSVSVFNRAFKETYGETPSSVRQKAERDAAAGSGEEEHLREGLDQKMTRQLAEYLHRDGSKEPEKKQMEEECCQFDVRVSASQRQIWNQVINIGSAADLLKSEIQEHVILLKQALNYEYVRFWSIFSKEMLIDASGDENVYNFSKLDQVLDFLSEQGIKPFFDMEEKIRRINQNMYTAIVYEKNPIVFKNIGHFQRVMDALMRHLVKRYGSEDMASWKMEVWFGGYTIEGMEPFDGYFHIFRSIYGIVKKYVPQMEVGGCGVFPEAIKDPRLRSRNIWKEWRSQAPRPDFISAMNYAYEADPDGKDLFGYRNCDSRYLLHSVLQLKNELKQADFDDIQLYITEWNLTVSDRNYINDTCFQGAYVIKNVIDVCESVDMLGYFTGTDRVSQHYDSGQLLYGGAGLLNKDSILKPSAFAVDFLNHLLKYTVKKGGHFWMTTDRKGSYHMVCHNMKEMGQYYYMTDEGMLEKENVEDCFKEHNPLHLEIGLDHIDSGEYVIRMYRVNKDSGSILDIWKEIGFHQELLRDDVKYIRRICEPRLAIWNEKVDNNLMVLNLELKANEFALVRICKV